MHSPLSVSIVLYKTPLAQLQRCLGSLQQVFPAPHVHLVDNSPTDALRVAQSLYAGANYTHLPANPGFGSAHNVAIRSVQDAGFSYHLVLNADVYFDGDVLSPMIEFLEQHPGVGQIMPKVLNPDGSIQRLCKLLPTPSDLLWRRFLSGKAKARSNFRFELHESGYDKVMFVPYLSGCFMLLRHGALKDVGLFDERFFMYPEDIDLTRRMAQRYETLFFPMVSVYHEHGAASHKSLRMFWVHASNMIKYFNKWGWVHDPIRSALNRKALAGIRSD
ncbi:MAG: glycosyltransferase family 2 protein [Steroidobacteraceae bacterium]